MPSLLVACYNPLVVGEDARCVSLVQTAQRTRRRVVVKEVELLSVELDSLLAARHRVHPPAQLVKDPHRPVPSDYLLRCFKTIGLALSNLDN